MRESEVVLSTGESSSACEADFDFEDFFENGGIALHLVGTDGTILHANKAELELLGYPRDRYIGRHISDFHIDRDAIDDMLARLETGEKLEKYPARLRRCDGSVKHVEITSSARFRDGKLVNTRCFTVDVTDLHHVRNELSRRENQFHQILESLPVAIYTTDRHGKITYYNRAAAELAGREPEIGKDEWCVTLRLFTPDGRPLPHDECPMAIALKENRPVRNQEAVAQRPDGSFFRFLPYPTPIRDESGDLVGVVNMLFDLTDRQRADEARQHLSAIVESSFDAIVGKDLNGIITSWNQAAERLFGYDADEAIGNPIKMLIPSGHQEEERVLERIRVGERIESYETIRRRKDGRLVPVSLTVSPIRDATGQVVGASKIARDISIVKESEQRIRALMREVNHRVKNQYAVIISMIRETNKRTKSPDDFERQVRERVMALSRAHDLLVLGDWRGVTILELLRSQARPFANEELIAMSGPPITLGPNAVQYLGIAFHELASNSARYGVLAGNGGRISVTWHVTGSDAARVFNLNWTESDCARVKPIGKGGFGSVVLKRVTAEALGGKTDLAHQADGLSWTLDAPMKFVEAPAPTEAVKSASPLGGVPGVLEPIPEKSTRHPDHGRSSR